MNCYILRQRLPSIHILLGVDGCVYLCFAAPGVLEWAWLLICDAF